MFYLIGTTRNYDDKGEIVPWLIITLLCYLVVAVSDPGFADSDEIPPNGEDYVIRRQKVVDFLEEGNPSFTGMMDESIPLGMRPYYQEYNAFFNNAYDEAPCFTICLADISRGMGKQFKAMKKQDEIPSLTTGAWYKSVWGFGKDGRRKAPSCAWAMVVELKPQL